MKILVRLNLERVAIETQELMSLHKHRVPDLAFSVCREPTPVIWLDLEPEFGIAVSLIDIVPYLSGLKGTPSYGRLQRISFPDADRAAAMYRTPGWWRESDAQRRDPSDILYRDRDVHQIVLLATPLQFQYEAACMRHCVEDYYHTGKTVISLRDPDNRPRATLQVDNAFSRVVQASGRFNRPIGIPERKRVNEFLEASGLSWSRSQVMRFDLLAEW